MQILLKENCPFFFSFILVPKTSNKNFKGLNAAICQTNFYSITVYPKVYLATFFDSSICHDKHGSHRKFSEYSD